MGIFKLTLQSKKLLVVVAFISIAVFIFAYFYYSSKNNAEDPRVVNTKKMFMQYEKLVKEKQYMPALILLDSIENIFNNTPGYAESFETGIVENNRASIYISLALYEVQDITIKNNYLVQARFHANRSIEKYEQWKMLYGQLSEDSIISKIKPYFPEQSQAFAKRNYKKLFQKRVKDIVLAQKEIKRRLSVAFTNLGIIQRHQHEQSQAAESYIKALKLWKENHIAWSNLNVLFGLPPTDRGFFEKLFPPDKNKFD